MQSKEEDWSTDLWDDLVKERPEHWNIRDALKHGKSEGRVDPSKDKIQHQREESPKKAKTRAVELEGEPPDYKKTSLHRCT